MGIGLACDLVVAWESLQWGACPAVSVLRTGSTWTRRRSLAAQPEFFDAKLDAFTRVCDTGKLEGSLSLGGGDGFELQVAAGLAELATDSNLAGEAVEVPLAATVELAYVAAVEVPCYEYAQDLGGFGALADAPALAGEDSPVVHFADFAAGRIDAAGKPAGNLVASGMEEPSEHLVFVVESQDSIHVDGQVQEGHRHQAVVGSEASEESEPVRYDSRQVLQLHSHLVEAGLMRLGLDILAALRAEPLVPDLLRL